MTSTLRQFSADFAPPTKFSILAVGRTYLPENKHIWLADVEVRPLTDGNAATGVPPQQVFTVEVAEPDELSKQLKSAGLPEDQGLAGRAQDVRKRLADVLMRAGLLQPVVREEDMRRLTDQKQLVVLTDTNIINLGVLNHILDSRDPTPPLLAIIPVTALLELQKHTDDVNQALNRKPPTKLDSGPLKSLLQAHPMGITALHHIQDLKQRCLVEFVEVDPATLQFFYLEAGGQRSGTKADRIIIESIKQVAAGRRTSADPVVLTADKSVAKFLAVENLRVMYVEQPSMPSKVRSIHYNLHRKAYHAVNLHLFLWLMAEAFADLVLVPARTDEPKKAVCSIGQPREWTFTDWTDRTMEVDMSLGTS